MRFLVIFSALLLSACALTTINDHYSRTVSSWRWGQATQLTERWGRPTKITALPNGNKVYLYEKDAYRNYPPPAPTATLSTVAVANGRSFIVVPTPASPSIGPSYYLTCTTLFEIDPRGIIVDARAQGNDCTADQGFMIARSNPHAKNR